MSKSTREELSKYIVTVQDVEVYQPASHRETTNLRYLEPGRLGCKNFEVIVGRPKPGGGGEPHYHETSEQIFFVMQGRGITEIEGEQFEIGPQTLVFHPPGQMHRELSITEDFLAIVVYTPPIGGRSSAAFKTRA